MLNICDTKEVSKAIGKSVRRTQELIRAGKTFPTLEVVENGKVRLGVRREVLDSYLQSLNAKATKKVN